MKVIFLDIDGTLVDYEAKMPESAIRAVQKAREKGNKVYLTTGRSKAEVYPELWDIGIDGMIGGNGMYIEDNGEVILDLAMKKEDVTSVVQWMDKNDLGYYLESKNGLFGSDNFKSKIVRLLGEDNEENRKRIDGWFPEMIFGAEMYRDDVAKISFCLTSDKLAEAREKFSEEMQVSSWSLTGEKEEFGEFSLRGADKLMAVKILLNYLNANVDDTFAFGDASSDSKMVQYCNIGVAMGNASEELKEVADYVTTHVNEDGLWNAFEKYSLV